MGIIQFKQANCKNCYKCIKHCPVKSIDFRNNQAQIIEDECILCGNCYSVCPQNAKVSENQIEQIRNLMKNNKVYVSLAPSYVSAFNITPHIIRKAIKNLGFYEIEETAVGAYLVSQQYNKLIYENQMKNIITTACPTIVNLVEKYYPSLISQLAPVDSPMIAHAKYLKNKYGNDIKIVFIGPCISKKQEAKDYKNIIDGVISFDELYKWFEESNIILGDSSDSEQNIYKISTQIYPMSEGILKTISKQKNYKYLCIDGIESCIKALQDIENKALEGFFIEMSSCDGSCINGPCIRNLNESYIQRRSNLLDYIEKNNSQMNISDIKINLDRKYTSKYKQSKTPNEEQIQQILNKIGKYNKAQELNCSSCGYETCREKAIAVYNGKANLYMCMPYMKELAESMSNIVINATPNAIILVDENYIIRNVNPSVQRLFKKFKEDLVGKYIYDIIGCTDFYDVFNNKKDIINKKYTYNEYNVIVEQSLLYNKENNLVIAILKDITDEENNKERLYNLKSETLQTVQKVIDKQMRVAQEIASLLGETTAETKVTLTKLKKSILEDSGDK